MKKNLLYFTLLCCLSCKKENGGEEDAQLPVIMLMSPTNNQVFNAGQTVNITANITDNQKLREVHLEITNTTTGSFLTHEHYAPDGATYIVSSSFVTQAAATYRIKVEAEDMSKNSAKAEISITSN